MIIQNLAGNRMWLTRLGVIACFSYGAIATPSALLPDWSFVLGELIGFTLLVSASMGRIWCHIYIGGRKNTVLISTGPYSVVRNPLYLCNVAAGIGFGFAVAQPVLVLALSSGFLALYPAVVAKEERDLLRIFGNQYLAYACRTPRWIPRFRNYREVQQVTLDPSVFLKALANAAAIMLLIPLWELIEHLRSAGLLVGIL